MKVDSVTFCRQVKVGTEYTAEINSVRHVIVVDMGARCVRVDRTVIPFECVSSFQEALPDLSCPECQQKFVDARAIGAHRRHKHGVRGESVGRGET